MKNKILIIVTFICFGFLSNAQQTVPDEIVVDNTLHSTEELPEMHSGLGNDLARFGDAVVYSWTMPVRWEKQDWLKAGIIVGSTGLLLLVDEPINDFWKKQNSGFLNSVERVGFHSGKPYAAFVSVGGFYAVGLVFKNEWAKETAMILGSSYLASGALQTLMKTAAGRARPGAGVGNMSFDPFSKNADYHSFPSGHIQVAMVTATVLAERVDNVWLKAVLYATAASTVVARMYTQAHWSSDLFIGAAISWFIAKNHVKRWEQTKTQKPFSGLFKNEKNKVVWNIQYYGNGIGITGRF